MSSMNRNAEEAALTARILAACRELKLPTVLKRFESLYETTVRKKKGIRYLVAEALEEEVKERMANRVRRRLKEANFPRQKSIDEFDFGKAKEIPESTIRELLTGLYIDQVEGVIFLGDSGTGKSHLATALGMAACQQGRRVQFVTAANLVNQLVEAKDAQSLSNVIRRYSRYELLLIDDLGYLPLTNAEAELLFQVLAERSERRSLIVTTNLPFSEFTKVFPDKRLCAAVLDRLTHKAHIIDTGKISKRRPLSTPRCRGKRKEIQPDQKDKSENTK